MRRRIKVHPVACIFIGLSLVGAWIWMFLADHPGHRFVTPLGVGGVVLFMGIYGLAFGKRT